MKYSARGPTSRTYTRTCFIRFFYASSACIYPEGKQLDTKVEGGGLKEQDAWPAQARSSRRLSDLPYLRQLLFSFCLMRFKRCKCRVLLVLSKVYGQSRWTFSAVVVSCSSVCRAGSEFASLLQPQDAYGLEKLASEELAMHYDKDFSLECRIARFHNIYGPYGTWKGGREKAPAAFCRKASAGLWWCGLCCGRLQALCIR